MSPEPIGAVSVSIEGDYSQLQSDFDAAVSAAQSAGQEIAAGLTPGFDQVSAAADATSAQLAGLDESMQATVPASSDASAGLGNFSAAAVDAGHSAEEAHSMFTELLEGLLAFAGIEFGLELIKELGQEMISSADKIDHTAISLTALTGNAEGSVETLGKLEELAREDALSFPNLQSAAQRMTAFLGPSADVVDILGHVADAAAATGKDVEAAANSFDRAAASGTLNSRSLMALGLTLNDVAAAMGTTSDAAKDAFKALDQSDRIDVLTEALSKFEGLAGATADTISGRWQQLKNDWETALIAMGEALSPLIKGLETLADELVQGVGLAFQGLVLAINALGGPLGVHIQTTKDAEQAAAAHALAVVGEKEALSGEVGTVDQSSEAHARAMASVLAHSHEIQATADVLKQYNLTSVDEAKALLAAGDANITTTKAVGDAAATLANYGVVNVDAAAKITATAQAQLQATSGANQHADAIHKAAQVLADFGVATTAEADALDKSKGEHDAVTTAVQTAAKELEKYGITTTAAGLAVQQFTASSTEAKNAIGPLSDLFGTAGDRAVIVTQNLKSLAAEGLGGTETAATETTKALEEFEAAQQAANDSAIHAAVVYDDVHQAYGAYAESLAGGLPELQDSIEAGKEDTTVLGALTTQFEDVGNTVLDVTTALTAWDSELGISSKDVEQATAVFYDLSQGMDGASGAAKSFGSDIGDVSDKASTASNSMATGLGTALDAVITGSSNASDAFLKFGESLLKTVTDTILKGAIEPLLGGLSSVEEGIGSIFSGGSGGGGILGGLLSGAGSAVSGIGSLFSGLASSLGGALPVLSEALGLSHSDTLLSRIEENTRYLNIEFSQNAPHMWTDAMTADIDRIANGNTPTGAIATHASTISVSIAINGANQDPQSIAQAIASYLRTISPAFSVTTA